MITTKDSILNAAEKLFSEYGYEATSLRAITAEAGVNLAAVNYHFQSKEQLLQSLFTRGMKLLNWKRLKLLETYEAEYGKKPIPLEKLVRALIEPMFDITVNRSKSGKAFSVLLGRMYSSPRSGLDNLLLADIRQFAERFEIAIQRTLPGIPKEDLFWRSFFALGATAHTLASSHLLKSISHGLCDPEDKEATLERLVTFIAAGWKASTETSVRKKKSP